MRLIRAENPTDRGLPRDEQQRRYRRKSALQSRLVEDYADELTFTRDDPRTPSLIAIRHRLLDAEACHAILEELSEAARSIAQRALDVSSDEAAPAHPAASGNRAERTDPRTHEPSLAAGDQCLADYDYDGARSNYDAVWRATASADAATRLLSLNVDHLAADGEAVELASSLPPAVGRAPALRATVALACARLGLRDDAERWLHGADERRSAEALAALARLCVTAGDLPCAQSFLQRALRADPSSASTLEASREVERAMSRDLAAEEEALERQAHSLDAQVQHARRILLRHPTSRAARRVLSQAEESAKRTAATEALARAEGLLRENQLQPALDLVRTIDPGALCAGARGQRDALEHRLRGELAAAESARRVAAAAQALRSTPWDVEPYVSLPPEERRAVRVAAPSDAIELLERLLVTPGLPRRDLAVAAIDALLLARKAASPAAALALLDPHLKLLSRLPEVAAWIEERRTLLRHAERLANAATLDRVRAARRAFAWEKASEELPRLSLELLNATERSEVESIRRDVEEALEQRAALSAYFADCASGRPEALPIAALRARTAPEPFRAGWQRAQEEGRSLFEARLQLLRAQSDEPCAPTRQLAASRVDPAAYSTEHDCIVIADCVGKLAWVRVVAASTGAQRGLLVFSLPSAAASLHSVVRHDIVRIVFGCVLALDIRLSDLEIIARHDVGQGSSSGSLGCVSWNGDALWIRGGRESLRIFEIPGRMIGTLTCNGDPFTVPAPGAGWFVRRTADRSVYEIMSPSGSLVGPIRVQAVIRAASAHPSGEGFFACASEFVAGSHRFAFVVVLDSAGREQRRRAVDAPPGKVRLLPAVRERIVILSLAVEDACILMAFSDEPGQGTVELWTVVASSTVVVVTDVDCLDVHAWDRASTAPAERLGRQPPNLPRGGSTPGPSPTLILGDLAACTKETGPDAIDVHAFAEAIKASPGPVTLEEALRIHGSDDPVRAGLCALHALRRLSRREDAAVLRRDVAGRYPTDPRIAFHYADAALQHGDLDGVAKVLADFELATSLEGERHAHHLAALVAFSRGDEGGLDRELRAMRGLDGSCDVRSLELMLRLLGPRSAQEDAETAEARALLDAFDVADTCLAAGDRIGALRALDARFLWERLEVQAAARRIKAALGWQPTHARDRAERRIVLMQSAGAIAGPNWQRRCLLIPRSFMNQYELEALAKEALTAVDADSDSQRADPGRPTGWPASTT